MTTEVSYIEVDISMNEFKDEVVMSIRTIDGRQLTPQDIIDAVAEVCLYELEHQVQVVDQKEIEENTDLN